MAEPVASITKTPSGYRARYRTPSGASRSRTFPRKIDAERWITSTEHSKLTGAFVDPQLARVRLGSYAEDWLATKVDISERTRINVEGRLRNYVMPVFGERALGAIEPADVRRFVADLVGGGLAPSTVRATYNALAAVLRQAEADRLIVRSPCVEVQLPREPAGQEMRFLSPDEVARLAAEISERYSAAVLTAGYTGMRAGELWALKADRLDLLRGTVEVAEALSEVRGQLVTKGPKTGRRRTVALPRFLCDKIGVQIGRYPSPAGYVFAAGEGGPVRHRNFVRRHFAPAVTAADLAPLRFHDLRHSCAAILIDRGHNLHEVKEQLGHSSIRVTSDRYGHLFPEARVRVAASLDEAYLSSSRVTSVSRGEVVAFPEAR